ncbi:MAG: MMPL family transporter [Thermoanaerobacterales bacterium]|nr:MMPL family transporter [Thermoanaerobacterales bacterium]
MSQLLYRLGRRTAAHPFRTIAVWALLAAVVFALQGAVGNDPVNDYRVPGVESQEAADTLEARFPEFAGVTGRVVFHVDEGRIDDPANRAAVDEAVDRLATGADVTLVADPFDPDLPTVSPDGRTAFATVQYGVQTVQPEHYDDVVAAVEPARDAGVQAEVSGEIAWAAAEIEGQEAIGLAVALVVLLVAFGSIIAAGMPLATALVGVAVGLAGLGIMAGFADVPQESPVLAVMIGLGVGIDYALFVVTRFRQHLHEGMPVTEAAGRANATAGQAVLFAGTTVVIAIVGLVLAGLPAVTTMGLAVAITVVVAMAIAVTLLPALMGWAGERIDRFALHRRRATDAAHETLSGRWAHRVGRRPGRYATVALVGLLALAAPVLSLRVGFADDGNAPPDTTQRRAYDLTTAAYGPGVNGPLTVVVEGEPGGDAPQRVAGALAATEGVASVTPPVLNEDGDTAVLFAFPTTAPGDEATADLLGEVRAEVLPAAVEGTGATAQVTGGTAFFEDLSDRIADRLPLFIAAVVALSFVLLAVVFRSILVPLKAAVMNVLSIGAAYGVVVAIFQWGWGKDLIGLDETVPVNPFVPLIMFAILFGLSMDYEVFLLSRVREEWLRTGDSHTSVVDGLGVTARVITSAALIMISVFLGFVIGDDVLIKMFGVGLATAVLLDATVVRMVLVPATMALLGDANWWLPRWLDRVLPHLDLEGGPDVPAPAPAPAPAAAAGESLDLRQVVTVSTDGAAIEGGLDPAAPTTAATRLDAGDAGGAS